MNEQLHTYLIGPHRMRLADATGSQIVGRIESLLPFETNGDEGASSLLTLRIDHSEEQAAPPSGMLAEPIGFDWDDAQCTIFRLPHQTHRIDITPRGSDHTYRMMCRKQFTEAHLGVPLQGRESETLFIVNNFLMMLFAFAAAPHGTLLMHASVVAYQGRGYLFLGKSGTGKSTHSRLWLKHVAGSYLLNDDNPLVHIDTVSHVVSVYGSPWSGKTPCYRNEQLPAGAFVRLEQAAENSIRPLSVVHAFAALMPSCSSLKQEPGVLDGIIRSLTLLSRAVPVYRLLCRPDREAACLCCHTVTLSSPCP